MNKNTGGAAFPHAVRRWDNDQMSWCVESDGGMTLLDYFAAHASEEDIQEHTTKVWTDGNEFGEGYFIPTNTREEAKYAYAEAMLKAREATE
jgi:hypothetical protein